jgi:hypothetical protein
MSGNIVIIMYCRSSAAKKFFSLGAGPEVYIPHHVLNTYSGTSEFDGFNAFMIQLYVGDIRVKSQFTDKTTKQKTRTVENVDG